MTTSTLRRQESTWRRHFFYRQETLRTTWKFRLLLLLLVLLSGSMTRGSWIPRVGQSLVCTEVINPSDVILVENFDPSYVVFERAATLQKTGLAGRVLVPIDTLGDDARENLVSQDITMLLVRMARLQTPEFLPIRIVEPISLNAASQIRDFLLREQLRSVIVVTHGFRSKRSALIYHAVLDPVGITVGCAPAFGQNSPGNWTKTWHGLQEVTEQFLKLQYYRFYVLWTRAS